MTETTWRQIQRDDLKDANHPGSEAARETHRQMIHWIRTGVVEGTTRNQSGKKVMENKS